MKRDKASARVMVLTGAGISVASGVRPFRGPNGLWSEEETKRLSHKDALKNDLRGIWALWGGMRQSLRTVQPNAAHHALADFERRLTPQQSFLLVTQNVDGLHQKAGSRNVIELHGTVLKSRPIGSPLGASFYDDNAYTDSEPLSQSGQELLRPDIVLFGERLPAKLGMRNKLAHIDVFIAVGTSGTVTPAANYVRKAYHAGATTIWVNVEPQPLIKERKYFRREVIGPAEQVLPELLENLLQ